MKGTTKQGFILKQEYLDFIGDDLDKEELGSLMLAIFSYEATGAEPEKGELSPAASIMFRVIKNDLDYNREQYAMKVEANRENGKKGGRPRKDGTPARSNTSVADEKPEGIFENPKNLDIEHEHDIYIDLNIDSSLAAVAAKEECAAAAAAKSAKREVLSREYAECFSEDPTPHTLEALVEYELPMDVIRYAINDAADHNVRAPLKYIRSILDRCRREGVTTVEEAKARAKPSGGLAPVGTKVDLVELVELRRRMGIDA